MKIKALNIFFRWVVSIFLSLSIYGFILFLMNFVPNINSDGKTNDAKVYWMVLFAIVFVISLIAISTNVIGELNRDLETEDKD